MKAVAAQQLNKLRLIAQQQKGKGGTGGVLNQGQGGGGGGGGLGGQSSMAQPNANQFAAAPGTGCFEFFYGAGDRI